MSKENEQQDPKSTILEEWDTAYEIQVVNKKTGKVVQTIQNEKDRSFTLLGVPLTIKKD